MGEFNTFHIVMELNDDGMLVLTEGVDELESSVVVTEMLVLGNDRNCRLIAMAPNNTILVNVSTLPGKGL